jgi:hypothetical protein
MKEEFCDAYAKAADTATRSVSAGKKALAEQTKKEYGQYKDVGIQSTVRAAVPFASAAEVRAAKVVPLQERDEATRLAFWKARLDNDAVASFIGRSNEIIDIQ